MHKLSAIQTDQDIQRILSIGRIAAKIPGFMILFMAAVTILAVLTHLFYPAWTHWIGVGLGACLFLSIFLDIGSAYYRKMAEAYAPVDAEALQSLSLALQNYPEILARLQAYLDLRGYLTTHEYRALVVALQTSARRETTVQPTAPLSDHH